MAAPATAIGIHKVRNHGTGGASQYVSKHASSLLAKSRKHQLDYRASELPPAWRLVNQALTWSLARVIVIQPITDETELSEVSEAISHGPYAAVSTHFNTALSLLADRESPDYRNSIKESISAVEALCRLSRAIRPRSCKR
jgi:hypothetical protein